VTVSQTRTGLCLAVALACAGCGDDEEPWDVDTPPRHAYDDSRPPFVEVPDDAADQDAMAVPFEQMGGDDRGEGIVYTAALAGYYLMRIQDDGIGYHYEYDPVAGDFAEDDNLHRKCGATFTQVWLYRFTGRPEFRMSAKRAIEYLLSRASWQDDDTLLLRDLGATALISLSLTEYGRLVGTDEWDAEITGVGEYLLARVQEDGSFSEGTPLQWAQSHQALWRLYSYTEDERYLDALVSVARYFYDHRDDEDIIGPYYLYGLWANEPLTDLYQIRDEPWIRELVFAVGDEVASRQHTPVDDVDEDWVGGYLPNDGDGEPNWNSTLKLEAVIDAYRMADLVGDAERAETYRKSALVGTAFLQRLQHRLGEHEEFADEAFAVGGTPYAPSDPVVRLDVPHHMANAILKVVEYMDLEDYPGVEPPE
jgi:hypothetical protein